MTARAWYSSLGTAWRAALAVGSVHFLLSAPFLVGILTPSIHEGSLYAFGYVVLNKPASILVGGLSDAVSRALFGERHTLYQANLVAIGGYWLCWTAAAFACGALLDRWPRGSGSPRG